MLLEQPEARTKGMAAQRYLLDTNVLSDLLRHPVGAVRERIKTVGEEGVCTSIVVACELRYGAAKKRSAALSTRVDIGGSRSCRSLRRD